MTPEEKQKVWDHVRQQVAIHAPTTVVEVFQFLWVKGCFEIPADTAAFVELLHTGFNAPWDKAKEVFQKLLIDEINLHEKEFPTSLAIFKYLDQVGWFFDNTVERANFLHKAEQLD